MTTSTPPGLKALQQRMAVALMLPLTPRGRLARRAAPVEDAVKLIKPNRRLTSIERLEIYSRSYWSRVLDSLSEDFPGLNIVLGADKFERLAKAYLTECPSQSFTLRDLGSRLEDWLLAHPGYAGRKFELALDMARLEWAHIVAFDGPGEEMPGPDELARPDPGLRLGLQPYITLLELHYPVDELRVKVNAWPEAHKAPRIDSSMARFKSKTLFVAVHRMHLSVFYRRLSREQFHLLTAIQSGEAIGKSISIAFEGSSVEADAIPRLLQTWFTTWTEFGWLCARRTSFGKK